MLRFQKAYHFLKEMATGRAGCNRNQDLLRQLFGFLGSNQQSVDGRSSVEVSDALLLQEFPDERVIDLAQADVCSSDSYYRPRERPSHSVEPVMISNRRVKDFLNTYMGRVQRYLQRPLLRPDSIMLARAAR